MDASELPLVPPARLAVLLTAKRRESGLDLADLSRRSDQRFSPNLLDRIEKGQVDLDESSLHALVDLYDLNAEVNLPKRSKLILDLDTGRIGVGDTALPFENSTADVVLERYVSLLYLLRNEKPGRRLSLRDDDLDVLGSTLDLTVTNLTDELIAIMGASTPDEGGSWLSRRVTIGAAGLLVGITTVGSLIIVGMPGGRDAPAEPVASGDTTEIAVAATHDGIHRATPTSVRSSTDSGASKIVLASATTQPQTFQLASAPVEATPVEVTLLASTPEAATATPTPQAEIAVEVDPTPEPEPVAEAAEEIVEETTEETIDQAVEGETDSTDAVIAEVTPTAGPIDLAAIEAYVGSDLSSLVPGWTIDVGGPRIGYKGMTNRSARTITVYVNPSMSVAGAAEALAHEIGHAIDLDRLDDNSRMEWIEMRGMPRVWWAGEGLNDFSVGAGDFAEGVAAYLTGSPSNSVYGGFSSQQLAFVGNYLG